VRRAAQERMDNLAFEAVARIGALLNSSDEHVQLAAARSVLSLAGIDRGHADVRALAGEPADELTRHEIDRIIASAREGRLAAPG
jgi:hypothetical protein